MENIVIIGGGAGGLELATRLGHSLGRRNKARVILVDRNRTHIWKPLLHEVATGALDTHQDGVVYRAHAAAHHYQFQLGTLYKVDPEQKCVYLESIHDPEGREILPERTIQYDKLVMAVGSISNDFGTPGVQKHCYLLDSHPQADRFHQALLNQFLRISQENSIPTLRLAIVGGGATGVELAAELCHAADMLKVYGLQNVSAQRLSISLIEAGPRILPALPERISGAAKTELARLGIKVREGVRITEATNDGFLTQDGELIASDMLIWAAGVKAPEFITQMAVFETNRAGQIMVKGTLQSTISDDIYVLGDCCACQQPDGSWVPPRAQSAHQMASCVAKNILAERSGSTLKEYHYHDHGSLVNLSRYSTVGSLMGNLSSGSMFVEGRIARLVYVSLYRMHQFAIHGKLKGALVILAEKIGRTVRPKLKLH